MWLWDEREAGQKGEDVNILYSHIYYFRIVSIVPRITIEFLLEVHKFCQSWLVHFLSMDVQMNTNNISTELKQPDYYLLQNHFYLANNVMKNLSWTLWVHRNTFFYESRRAHFLPRVRRNRHDWKQWPIITFVERNAWVMQLIVISPKQWTGSQTREAIMEVLFGVWPGCLSITLHSLTSAGSSSIIVTPLFLPHRRCTMHRLQLMYGFLHLLLFFFS